MFTYCTHSVITRISLSLPTCLLLNATIIIIIILCETVSSYSDMAFYQYNMDIYFFVKVVTENGNGNDPLMMGVLHIVT